MKLRIYFSKCGYLWQKVCKPAQLKTTKRCWETLKKTQIKTVFLDPKIQYCYDSNSSQMDLRIDAIQIKNPASFYAETDKLILEFIWEMQRT